MNMRSISIVLILFGLAVLPVFGMKRSGGDDRLDQENKKHQKAEEDQAINNNNNNRIQAQIEDFRRIQQARYQAQQQKQQEEKKRKDLQEHEAQELLHKEKELQELQVAQDREESLRLKQTFRLLLDEMSNWIMALKCAEDFEAIAQAMQLMNESICNALESGLNFELFKQSQDKDIQVMMNELFGYIVKIVAAIQDNKVAGVSFNTQTINGQLQIICQLIGYEGGVEVQVEAYTDEDDLIAQQEQQQINESRTAGDDALARLLQGAVDEEALNGDEELARRLQEELDRDDEDN